MSSASSSASAASCNAGGDNRGTPDERDVRAFDDRRVHAVIIQADTAVK
jgi:hypothetical protein